MRDDQQIDQNIEEILDNIKNAAEKNGRGLEDIHLIAVTKTVDVQKMKWVSQKGLNHFGENRVQELQEKYDQFGDEINWHLIGHLQRNKVKYIIDKVQLIHSVDSIRLAQEINNQAAKINRQMPILIQINIAQEESKFGFKTTDIEECIEILSNYDNILIKGLMTIAPFEENIEKTRPIFRELREIYDRIKKNEKNNINMEYLSMGMTNDYLIAIEEGANMVRIGSGIFGKRNF